MAEKQSSNQPKEKKSAKKKQFSQPKIEKPEKLKKSVLLATGLEDYGKWQTMFQDHQPDPNEPPFRRGRIWS